MISTGKAGGLSVVLALRALGISGSFGKCHPQPNKCTHRAGPPAWAGTPRCPLHVFIPVRAPTERFTSAFDFAVMLQCAPGDRRTVHRPGDRHPAHANPTARCRKDGPEARLLARYGHDANQLAEALCGGGRARADLAQIQHSAGLAAWLPPESAAARVYAAPMRAGYDFPGLVRAGLEQLVRDANRRNCSAPVPLLRGAVPRDEAKPHSTRAHADLGLLKRPSVLSPRGAACVARHYDADYAVLARLRDTACRGPLREECRAAIGEMLDGTAAANSTAER